jgi:hypothetical protein
MTSNMTRRQLLGVGATTVALGIAGCLGTAPDEPWEGTLAATTAHQYSAPGCSCCHEYAGYLKQYLDVPLSRSTPDDIVALKRRYEIPNELWSCHTLVIDDYVVEGHVPVEVIATLLDDAPAIGGIALPGMPAGSPGMPGEKDGRFTIYVVGGDRPGATFTEV